MLGMYALWYNGTYIHHGKRTYIHTSRKNAWMRAKKESLSLDRKTMVQPVKSLPILDFWRLLATTAETRH